MSEDGACKLKFVFVNDVYLIDGFARYATAKRIESGFADLTVGVLSGDFLSPSVLSSLDKGVAIVNCMNASGIDYVCLGNHEYDLGLDVLQARITESKFTWINSNMTAYKPSKPLPRYSILEVKNGKHIRRVALVGMLTEDPKAYPPNAFGGAKIEPIIEAMANLYEEIMTNEKVDAIVPLTHQDFPHDKELAKAQIKFPYIVNGKISDDKKHKKIPRIPVILGGHDHDVFCETVNGCTIFKTGMDIQNIGIVDLVWSSIEVETPDVNINLKNASQYPRDPQLDRIISSHMKVIDELEHSPLCDLPKYETISSQEMRSGPNSFARFLLTWVRVIMELDERITINPECILVTSGTIKGNQDYSDKESLTYSDLNKELPYQTGLIVLPLPGSVIQDIMIFTRVTNNVPKDDNGAYMQTDDAIVWDVETNKITFIGSDVFEPDRIYQVGLAHAVALKGPKSLGQIEPLLKYVKSQQFKDDHAFTVSAELAVDMKDMIIKYFSKVLLLHILIEKGMKKLDTNGDGVLSKEEVAAGLQDVMGEHVGKMLVDNLFEAADLDNSGTIEEAEVIKLYESLKKKSNQVGRRKTLDMILRRSIAAKRETDAVIVNSVKKALALEGLDTTPQISKTSCTTSTGTQAFKATTNSSARRKVISLSPRPVSKHVVNGYSNGCIVT